MAQRGALWAARSLGYLDFSEKALAEEAAQIGYMTHGAFTYQGMREMPFTLYEHVISRVPKLLRKQEGKSNG